MSRRQAESMTDDPDADVAELQEHRALIYERTDVYHLLDDVDCELRTEMNPHFEYRTPTARATARTPWMRMSEEEREHIRRRRRLRVVTGPARVPASGMDLGEAA